jgi:hypothetical protein
MSKRRYLLALSVPLLMLTVAFSTRTTAAATATAATGTGSPGFTVWPTFGGPPGDTTSPDCNGSTCWVILGNPANASASLAWGATTYETGANGGPITFTPSHGVLAPGQHVKVIIHNTPCDDDGNEWIFSGYALSTNVSGNAEALVPHDCG